MVAEQYDVAIVGAGILGLAHALAARRLGKSVIVIDRSSHAVGASIQNFGFVTISGQLRGDCWTHARRAREIWAEIAAPAGITPVQHGLIVTTRRPEGEAVIDAFLDTEMGEGCARLTTDQALTRAPAINPEGLRAALWSPLELRAESREAIPALARWLAADQGVRFLWGAEVRAIDAPHIQTTAGPLRADTVIVCPGDNLTGLYADHIAAAGVTRCKLHMLRVTPDAGPLPASALPCAVMSDLSLGRYHGFADLPEAAPLKAALDADQPEARQNGVHLIAVRSADGSLVVGDSHHYGASFDPFQPEAIDRLILDEMDRVLAIGPHHPVARWIGTYASAPDWLLDLAPAPGVRLVMVTAGCGASTAFSIGEQTLASIFKG